MSKKNQDQVEGTAGMPRRTFLKATGGLLAGAAIGLPAGAKASTLPYEEYAAHDAVGLAALIHKRDVSAAEVLEAAIARTEAVNPAINAVVLKHYDLARKSLADAPPAGPLAGVPLLLKDLGIFLKGTVTTAGEAW